VTLEEAWRELGVEPDADAETVRRAYLRLIRTRKPESDPVGFKRAREAFEIARAGSEIEWIAAGMARRRVRVFGGSPVPIAAAPPRATPAATDAPSPPAPDPAREPPAPADPAPADDGPARNDVVFEGFSRAWHSIPPSADQRQRLEIAREAVAVLPRDPRAHWLLVTTFSRLGQEAGLADALRAGWRAGWPEFLEALLIRVPGRATREEIEAGFTAPAPTLRLAAAAAAVRWDAPRAAAVIVDLCAAAMAAPLDARGDGVRELPISRMLDVILALHDSGALDAAADAQAALRGCLQESGLEIALVQGPLGGIWTLTEELGALPRDFPAALRASFASATRAGDLNIAYLDVCAAADRDRSAVALLTSSVQASAPNVASIMRNALARQRARAAQAHFRPFNRGWILVPVLIAMVRVCTSINDHSPSTPAGSTRIPAYAAQPLPPAGELFRGARGVRPGDVGFAMLVDSADELCGAKGTRRAEPFCAEVGSLLLALPDFACDQINGSATEIANALRATATHEREARFLRQLTITRWQMCPGGRTAGAEAAGTGSDRP